MNKIKYFILFIFFLVSRMTVHAQEGGYVNPFSVSKGEVISFHVSTSVTPFSIKIYKLGKTRQLITTVNSITGGVRLVADSSYWYGCNWPVSYEFLVPMSWSSGIYIGEFSTSVGIKGIIFFVKESVLGSYSKTVVSMSTNTWQAYNIYGGKSLYNNISSNGERSYKVSYNRPYTDTFGGGQYFSWGNKLMIWLDEQNIPVEYTNNFELGTNPHTLDNYDVLVIKGHDEYWSMPERRQIERFVQRGGNVIILSGNTSWWQVRYEDEGRTIVCYKDSLIDPLFHIADSVLAVNWSSPTVNDPENKITGVSFRSGGYVAYNSVLPKASGYGDYTVYNSHHWIYEGTNLNDGESFGWQDDIVGYEADGAQFDWINGFPVVNGSDGTPANYKILGISPAANLDGAIRGHATMGIYHYPGGGWVFNGATTDWVHGLANDSIVAKITKNILRRFAKNSFPPDINSWSPFRVVSDSIHNELVYLNRREFLVLPNDSLVITVFASDPEGKQLHYAWLHGGLSTPGNAVYTYHAVNNVQNFSEDTVAVSVYSDEDTTTVRWFIYHSPLKIVSSPKTIQLLQYPYRYQLDVLNFYRDSLSFTLLESPSWLSMDAGAIIGDVPQLGGSFPVTVEVRNQHSQIDSQSYILKVIGPVTAIREESPPKNFLVFQNYPNPFNPTTTIEYSLPQKSVVELKIFNTSGQLIKNIFSNLIQEVGKYVFSWNGINERGELAGSGVYFCVLTALTEDGTVSYTETKKMILIK